MYLTCRFQIQKFKSIVVKYQVCHRWEKKRNLPVQNHSCCSFFKKQLPWQPNNQSHSSIQKTNQRNKHKTLWRIYVNNKHSHVNNKTKMVFYIYDWEMNVTCHFYLSFFFFSSFSSSFFNFKFVMASRHVRPRHRCRKCSSSRIHRSQTYRGSSLPQV